MRSRRMRSETAGPGRRAIALFFFVAADMAGVQCAGEALRVPYSIGQVPGSDDVVKCHNIFIILHFI